MKCYLDITLLPSADIALYFLWGKTYQQLHLALVEAQDANKQVKVGVSFPEYSGKRFHLGSKLRLFAPSTRDLEAVNINKWLSRLSDYVHITSIRDVPDKVEGYAHYSRVNKRKSNAEKAGSNAERLNIPYKQALGKLKGRNEALSKAPFIYMKSLSSGQRFRLLIALEKTSDHQTKQGFSTYGLSSTSTVPLF